MKKIVLNPDNPEFGFVILAKYVIDGQIDISMSPSAKPIIIDGKCHLSLETAINNFFFREPFNQMSGDSQWQIDLVKQIVALSFCPSSTLINHFKYLENRLQFTKFLAGDKLTIADIHVFSRLYVLKEWEDYLFNGQASFDIITWFMYIIDEDKVKLTFDELAIPWLHQKGDRIQSLLESVRNRVYLFGRKITRDKIGLTLECTEKKLDINYVNMCSYLSQKFEASVLMICDILSVKISREELGNEIFAGSLASKDISVVLVTDFIDELMEICSRLIASGKAYIRFEDERESEEIDATKSCGDYHGHLWKMMMDGKSNEKKVSVRAEISDSKHSAQSDHNPVLFRTAKKPYDVNGREYWVYPTLQYARPIINNKYGVSHVIFDTRDHSLYAWITRQLNLERALFYYLEKSGGVLSEIHPTTDAQKSTTLPKQTLAASPKYLEKEKEIQAKAEIDYLSFESRNVNTNCKNCDEKDRLLKIAKAEIIRLNKKLEEHEK